MKLDGSQFGSRIRSVREPFSFHGSQTSCVRTFKKIVSHQWTLKKFKLWYIEIKTYSKGIPLLLASFWYQTCLFPPRFGPKSCFEMQKKEKKRGHFFWIGSQFGSRKTTSREPFSIYGAMAPVAPVFSRALYLYRGTSTKCLGSYCFSGPFYHENLLR